MEKIVRNYITGKGYKNVKAERQYARAIYIFTEEIRNKFRKIMEAHPDFGDSNIPALFAYIPKSTIEKGIRRAHNSGEYVLFSLVDGKPKIIRDGQGKWRRKNTKRLGYWDIHREGMYGHSHTS